MSLDRWYDALQWGSVVLLCLTFLVGSALVIVGGKIKRRDAANTVAMQTALAQQQERAAKAERALLELEDRIGWRSVDVTWRWLLADGPLLIYPAVHPVGPRVRWLERWRD